jgi:hypothetical protein
MEDAALSAFSVFFTQTPSFLAYQRMMEGSKGKSNAQSLFGVHKIPSDNQIRDLLDAVPPEHVFPVFEEILQVLEQQGQLEGFRSVADTLLVAIDGTEYFSSRHPLLKLFNPYAEVGRDALLPQCHHAGHCRSGASPCDPVGTSVHRAARWP